MVWHGRPRDVLTYIRMLEDLVPIIEARDHALAVAAADPHRRIAVDTRRIDQLIYRVYVNADQFKTLTASYGILFAAPRPRVAFQGALR